MSEHKITRNFKWVSLCSLLYSWTFNLRCAMVLEDTAHFLMCVFTIKALREKLHKAFIVKELSLEACLSFTELSFCSSLLFLYHQGLKKKRIISLNTAAWAVAIRVAAHGWREAVFSSACIKATSRRYYQRLLLFSLQMTSCSSRELAMGARSVFCIDKRY